MRPSSHERKIETASPGRRGDRILSLVLVLAGLFYGGAYFDRGLDAFDEGLFATEAARVLDGGIYGIDFLAPYGPGRYYLIAGLFSLFGASFKVQACLWLALRGLNVFLAFSISRRLLPRPLAVLATLAVILAPGALHKAFFQTVTLLNFVLYLRYREAPSALRMAAAGLGLGAGALFRVDAALFGLISFLLLLGLERFFDVKPADPGRIAKRVLTLLGGAASITLPLFCFYWAHSRISPIMEAEWHRTLVVSGFAGFIDVPSPATLFHAHNAQELKGALLGWMVLGAPWIYVLVGAAALSARFRSGRSPRVFNDLALVLFGLPVLNQVRITPTFNHLLHAAPLLFIALALLAHRIAGSRLKGFLAPLLLVIPLALPVVYNLCFTRGVLPGSVLNRFEFIEPIDLPRAGIYETTEEAREIERVVRHIETSTSPDDFLFAEPFFPALYFLSGRRPAVRFLEPFYYFDSPPLQDAVVEDLKRTRPPLVVLDPLLRVGGRTLRQHAPRVYGYIRQHYQTSGSGSGRFQIWVRRRDR